MKISWILLAGVLAATSAQAQSYVVTSAPHAVVSTESSSSIAPSASASSFVSIAPGAGRRPIGVSTAAAVPAQRSNTHARTRELSP